MSSETSSTARTIPPPPRAGNALTKFSNFNRISEATIYPLNLETIRISFSACRLLTAKKPFEKCRSAR
jgi:hypothetical protein